MSDAINHYLCAKDVLEEDPFIYPLNEKLFYLGSQGPDIFFYHNVLEKQRRKITLGNLLHKSKINDFFFNGLSTCLNAPEEYKPLLRSYFLGLVCHHALDVFTHPFIFYRSGSYIKSRPETKAYKHNHKRYEVLLDIAYYQLRTGEKAFHFPIHRFFRTSLEESAALEYFYRETVGMTYDIFVEEGTVQKSLKKAERLTRMISDPTGLKRLAVGFGEILAGDFGQFSTAFYGLNPADPSLILNLDKYVWHHPCDLDKIYTDSYPELCEKAVENTRFKIDHLDPILLGHNPLDRAVLDSYFKDLAYDSGLDWKQGLPIQYFNPVI